MAILDLQRKHAEVFHLRLGDKAANGAPRKLTDSIRVTSPSKDVVLAFVAEYGGDITPWQSPKGAQFQAYLPTTALPIMVLPGQSLVQWWEMYRGSVNERRCDGYNLESGEPCLCPEDIKARLAAKDACRPMTRINVVCPDVDVIGAGTLVSHGIIAAETLPQSIALAEAALERGLRVPAVLRVVEHRGKRHFIVPQIEIVGVSLRTLATGETGPALTAGTPVQIERPTVAAIGSGGGVRTSGADGSPRAASTARRSPEMPPLPGEDDDPPHIADVRRALTTLTDAERMGLSAWWKDSLVPALRSGDFVPGNARLVLARIGQVIAERPFNADEEDRIADLEMEAELGGTGSPEEHQPDGEETQQVTPGRSLTPERELEPPSDSRPVVTARELILLANEVFKADYERAKEVRKGKATVDRLRRAVSYAVAGKAHTADLTVEEMLTVFTRLQAMQRGHKAGTQSWFVDDDSVTFVGAGVADVVVPWAAFEGAA